MAAAPAFDPLVDLDGQWTTQLADQYLPLPDAPGLKYECVDGRLFVSPTEGYDNLVGEGTLIAILTPGARSAGYRVTPGANLTIHFRTWIEPDVAVIHTAPRNRNEKKWIPAQLFALAVEFVSPSSTRRDRVEKPKLCAAAGVPHFMRVEINERRRQVSVTMLSLVHGEYQQTAHANAGELFTSDEPFPMRFDPAELLD
jgi:Uma2 family endonuclease